MRLDEPDEMADELVSRMAQFDEGLASSDLSTLVAVSAVAPGLEPRWRRLESCLRLLRKVYPGRPSIRELAYYSPVAGGPPVSFGRFRIRSELGRGGFGVVYLADDPQLERAVALKLPRPDALVNLDLRDRFLREARATAALDHPNLVPVYEAGAVGPICYIASAYCPGTDLARWLKTRSSPLEPTAAAALVAAIAEAVASAHARGIIHRDLKPSNILLTPRASTPGAPEAIDGFDLVPKLTDFGLAKLLEGETDQTATGVALGTPNYMSPEQGEGRAAEIGPTTDVYSLGVILYELLTLRVPFQGPTVYAILEQIRGADPVSPRQIVAAVPRELETICLECLQKDPHRRYLSANELAADLRRWLAHRPILARPTAFPQRIAMWYRRNPRVAVLTLAVMVLLAILTLGSTAASIWLKRSRDQAVRDRDRLRVADANLAGQLWESLRSAARALQNSTEPGRRFKSLELLEQAAQIKRAEVLRSEVATSLELVDLEAQSPILAARPGEFIFDSSPSFGHYFLADGQGTIRIVSLLDGRELARLPGDGRAAADGFVSADGHGLIVGYHRSETISDYVLWKWHDAPGPPPLRTKIDTTAPGWFCFSRDGRLLAGPVAATDTETTMGLFDVNTGKVTKTFPPGPELSELAFDSRARRLALTSTTSNKVRILDLETGAEAPITLDTAPMGIAWSEDDRLLAIGGTDHRIYIWDMLEQRLLSVLDGHQGVVAALAFTHQSDYLISSAWDGTTRVWDPIRGAIILAAEGANNRLWVAPDDQSVAHNNYRKCLSIYRLAIGGGCRLVHTAFIGNRSKRPISVDPRAIEYTADGRFLIAADGDDVQFVDVATGRPVGHERCHRLSMAKPSPDGSLLATFDERGLLLWPIARVSGKVPRLGKPRVLSSKFWDSRVTVSWDESSRLVAFNDFIVDQGVVFDAVNGSEQFRTAAHGPLTEVALSPDGRYLATATWQGSDVKVWDIARKKQVWRWSCESAMVAFSPDGRWLVTADTTATIEEKAYYFWRVEDWTLGPVIPASRPARAAFNRAGSICALSTLRGVILVDLRDVSAPVLCRLASPSSLTQQVSSLAFDAAGTRLVVGDSNHAALIWDLSALRRRLATIGLDWEDKNPKGSNPGG